MATSESGSAVQSTVIPGTNLLQNGQLITAFSGLPAGWLDNSNLLVNTLTAKQNAIFIAYSGCSIYSSDGSKTSAPCALQSEVREFQPITTDTVYVPTSNQILSVSTGTASWESGDSDTWIGSPVVALAGSYVIFVSGTNLLAQIH